jgi:uncharacterized MAPEG superfamily protein
MWVLLAFAAWTLLVLAGSVGLYRWSRILSRRKQIADFAEYRIEGVGWYKRGMRAHANCVENLPIYGAIVVVIMAAGIDRPSLDVLALILFGARILQSMVHVLFEQTDFVVAFRSIFYNTQFACMAAMIGVVVYVVTT